MENRSLLATFKIDANVFTNGADWSPANGNDAVEIAAGVIIDTSNANGTAGNITINAPSITIGDNVQLRARGTVNGAITLTAKHVQADPTLAVWNFLDSIQAATSGLNSSIDIGAGVSISGGAFSATASAGDQEVLQAAESVPFVGQFVQQFFSYVNDVVGTTISMVYKAPTAKVTVGAGSHIASSDSVHLETSSTANAVGEAIFNILVDKIADRYLRNGSAGWGGFSVGATYADVESTTTISENVEINANGSVTVAADARNTTGMTSRVTQNTGISPTNPSNVQVAIGVTYLKTTSKALVESGASITAGGVVDVTANATDNNAVSVSTSSYRDGLVGVAFGLAFSDADVEATVNGTVRAGTRDISSQVFCPVFAIDFSTSSIQINSGSGYATGDALVYSSGLGGAIPGLVSGETYYAITSCNNPKSIQLAATLPDALAGNNISFGAGYPTLSFNGRAIPITHLEVADTSSAGSHAILFDMATWPDGTPLFTEGQQVTYTSASGNYLGYNDSLGNLLGPLPNGAYGVHVINSTADSQNLFAIQLLDAQNNLIVLNDNPVFVTSNGTRLVVDSFDVGSGTIVFDANKMASQNVSLSNAAPLTYVQAIGTRVTGLTDGKTYYAVVDPTQPGVIQLAGTVAQADASDPTIQRAHPTLTANGAPLAIDSVEPDNGLIFGTDPGLADGTAVVYHAVPHKPIGGLTDGATYYAYNRVNPNFSSNLPEYVLFLKDGQDQEVAMSLQQTLMDQAGNTYLIDGTDAIHNVLTVLAESPINIDSCDDINLLNGVSVLSTAMSGSKQLWTNATGGQLSFTLTDNANTYTSAPLDFNASATDVQLALNQLPGMAVTVTGQGSFASPWLIQGLDLSSLNIDGSQLVNGSSFGRVAPEGTELLWNTAAAGSFILSVEGQILETAPLAFNATAADVEAALEALPGVQVDVTGAGLSTDPWVITGGIFPFGNGDALIFSDSYGLDSHGLLDGQTYYAAIAPSQPYPGVFLLGLAATSDDALPPSPSLVPLQGVMELGDIDTSYMSGTQHSLAMASHGSGITVQATLNSTDKVNVGTSTGGEPKLANLLGQGELAFGWAGGNCNWVNVWNNISRPGFDPNRPDSSLADAIQQQAEGQAENNKLSLAAAVGFLHVKNQVLATVGDTAVLRTDGDVCVTSKLTEAAKPRVESGVSKPKTDQQSTGVCLAAAVNLAFFDNTCHAVIESNASVTAGSNLQVESNITYPWAGQLANPNGFTVLFRDNTISDLATFLNGKLGVDEFFTNSWADAAAGDAKASFSLAVSVSSINFTNDCLAQIAEGAQVNQTSDVIVSPNQAVSVISNTTMSQVSFAGLIGLDFTPDSLAKAHRRGDKLSKTFVALTEGRGTGLGGSFACANIDNTTRAILGEQDPSKTLATGTTRVNFGDGGLMVEANANVVYLQIGQGGCDGQTYGISGTLAYNEIDTTTRATISSGVVIQSNAGTAGGVRVDSDDTLYCIAIAGGVLLSKNVDVGVSSSVNNITRNVTASIGEDPSSTPDASTITVGGPITVQADAHGVIVSASVAASVQSTSPPPGVEQDLPDNNPNGGANDDQNASYGWAVSGDFALVLLTDNVSAFIHDTGTFVGEGGAIQVSGSDDTKAAAAAGAAAFTTGANQKSVGLAGSAAVLVIDGDLAALVEDATLVGFSLNICAKNNQSLYGVAAGGSGSTVGNSSIAVAGSVVSTTLNKASISAMLRSVTANLSGDSTVTATDFPTLVSVAGTFVKGGKGGYGLGSTVNTVNNRNVNAQIVDSSITQSAGELSVSADESLLSDAIVAGLAISNQKIAGSGMFALNDATLNVQAALLQGQYTNTSSSNTANLNLSSSNTPVLVTVAGDVAVDKSGGEELNAGVGAAVSESNLSSSSQALLVGTAVNLFAGGVTILASSGDPPSGLADADLDMLDLPGRQYHAIYSFSVGAAGSKRDSGQGSVSWNDIHGSNMAAITQNAAAIAAGPITVQSTNGTTIGSAAGSITASPGGRAAVGAALSHNDINTNSNDITQATIDGASVKSLTGTLTVASNSNLLIEAAAAGGSGAEKCAAGGSVVVNTIGDSANTLSSTSASIANKANATAGSGLIVSAADHSTIDAAAGQVDVATKGSAIGASVATNSVYGFVTGIVSNSVLYSGGAVSVTAESSQTINAVAVGVGGSVSSPENMPFSVGLIGSGTGNLVVVHTQALIELNSSVTTTNGQSVAVSADNKAQQIRSIAGVASDNVKGTETVSAAVGASAAINSLGTVETPNTVEAAIDNSTLAAAGGVTVDAIAKPTILSVTVAGSGDFSGGNDNIVGIAGAGAGSADSIAHSVIARITNSTVTAGSPGINISADGSPDITGIAGNVAYGGATGDGASGVKVTVGTAIVINDITNHTLAQIDGGSVAASGNIGVIATDDQTVDAYAVGVAGSITVGKMLPYSVGLVGSACFNTIDASTQALILNQAKVQTSDVDSVTLSVSDTSSITAVGGSLTVDVQTLGTSSSAIGASAAINSLGDTDKPNTIAATIEDSTVTAFGGVSISATAESSVLAVTVAGAGSFTKSDGTDVGIAGAGAGSASNIYYAVSAMITGGTISAGTAGVILDANNSSSIESVSGGVAFGGAIAGQNGIAVSVGAAVAINTVTAESDAEIQGATVTTQGDVSVTATNNASIFAFTIGVAAALASGNLGIAVGGAGSGSGNTIDSHTTALIADSSDSAAISFVECDGNLSITATDGSTIVAGSGAQSLAIGLAKNENGMGVAVAVGISISLNTVEAEVTANINNSTVEAGKGVSLNAVSQAAKGRTYSIYTVSVAGGIGLDFAGGTSVVFPGAGAGAGNTVTNPITASITQCNGIDTSGRPIRVHAVTGNVSLTAQDNSVVMANGGGVSVGVDTGQVAVGVGIGAAQANNKVTNSVCAFLDNAQVVEDDGQVVLNGVLNSQSTALAFGVALQVSVAKGFAASASGSGAGAFNTIQSTVMAYVNSSDVSAGSTAKNALSISAVDSSTVTARGGAGDLGVGVSSGGVALAAGAVITKNQVDNTITAAVGNVTGGNDSTKITSAGGVNVSAAFTANVTSIAVAVAAAVAWIPDGGAGAGSGANSSNDIETYVTAAVQNGSEINANGLSEEGGGVSVTATENATINATVGTGALAVGVFGASVGVSLINNSVSDHVNAYIDNATVTTKGQDVSVTARSNNTISGQAVATSAAVAIGGAGAGGNATSTDSTAVQAYVSNGATIQTDSVPEDQASPTTYGDISISAISQTSVAAECDGGTAGLGSIGAFFANATKGGSALAYMDASLTLSCANITVSANSSPSVNAKGTSVTIGALTGDGTTSTSLVNDSITAYMGSSLTQSPTSTAYSVNGNITVNAMADADIVALSDGGTLAATLGVGIFQASSAVKPKVTAYAHSVDLTVPGACAISITATKNASKSNVAKAVAGSGGLVAGDAAIASTDDESEVNAGIYGGCLHAGNLTVLATNKSNYAPQADSINAAYLGGSGAFASNTQTSSATVTVDDGTVIVTDQVVQVLAQQQVAEACSNSNAAAGAGGVLNGTAAVSESTVSESSAVNIGNNVSMTAGTDPFANPGGILILASSGLQTTDQVTNSTGGLIEGAGVNSSTTATINNGVNVGMNCTFTSQGNIGVGTQTVANASANSAVNTYGVAGAGFAYATADLTSNQTVHIAGGTNITAFGNINIVAGAEPVGLTPSLVSGTSNALGYVYGIVEIPHANAESSVTSNAALAIDSGVQIQSGQNITVGALPGSPETAANGIAHYDELGIPCTQKSSHKSKTTSSQVNQCGTLTAGIYHELNILIANDGSAADGFSNRVSVNSDGSPHLDVKSHFDPNFSPQKFVTQNFTQDTATILDDSVSIAPVGAISLGPLYAVGGTVTILGDVIQGTGAATAYGGATITITNNSPDYLILGQMQIPNLPAGQISFRDSAGTISPAPAGIKVNAVNGNLDPSVQINQAYSGSVGDSSGPALFLMGPIENLGGEVSIVNQAGSLGQASTIYGKHVTIDIANGVAAFDIPNGTYYLSGNPYSEWSSSTIWPGGTGTPNANYAVSYVAGSVLGSAWPSATSFNTALYGQAGAQSPNNNSTVFFGNSLPYVVGMGDDTYATNFYWAVLAGGNSTYKIGSGGSNNAQGYLPFLPMRTLTSSASVYPSTITASPTAASIFTGGVSINAKTIDLNGQIVAGQQKNWSVNFSESLADFLQEYRQGYLQGTNVSATCAIPLNYMTTTASTDNRITASYNANTNQIVLDDISASNDAEVILKGAIVNTHPLGSIQMLGAPARVTVNNQSGIDLVVQDIRIADGDNPAKVDITDSNLAAGSNRTIYVYRPGQDGNSESIDVFTGDSQDKSLGTGTPTKTLSASSVTYSPQSGLRWQWVQKASLSRTVLDSNAWQLSDWAWSFPAGSPNDPWQYVDPTTNDMVQAPTGQLVTQAGAPVFECVVTGSIDRQETVPVTYHDGHYGFANNSGSSVWNYNFPLNVSLTITSSVKADNPILLDFSGAGDYYGNTSGGININSNSSIEFTGTIVNLNGAPTCFSATDGSISSIGAATILASGLNLTASDGIGVDSGPISTTLATNGILNAQAGSQGIQVDVNSDVVIGSIVAQTVSSDTTTYGDLVITATGNLAPASGIAGGTPNFIGSNITVVSSTGNVGTASDPLFIETHFTDFARGLPATGMVNAKAQGGIGLVQCHGDLRVGQVLAYSDVYLEATEGSILDAEAWSGDGLTDTASQSYWNILGLQDPQAAQATVVSFQNLGNRNYQIYWELMQQGSLQDGSYTPNSQAIEYFAPEASVALGSSPGNLDTTLYIQNLYSGTTSFFNQNLPANWQSQADFVTYNPNYQFTATPSQVANLQQNAVWNQNQLTNRVDAGSFQALSTVDSTTSQQPANVEGDTVTLVAGGAIGEANPMMCLSVAGLQNGSLNLTDEQSWTLSRANQPGDVALAGVHAGQPCTFAANEYQTGDIVSAVQVTITRPLLVSVSNAGSITAKAQTGINIQEAGEAILSGFGGDGAGWTTNGTQSGLPAIANDVLKLTDGIWSTASSAWFNQPISTGSFTVSFTYTEWGGDADGVAFVIHNDPRGLQSLGWPGGALGYGGSSGIAIVPSAAYEINIYSVVNGPSPGTNFVTNGAQGNYNSTNPVDDRYGHPLNIVLTYDESAQTLTESLTDTVTLDNYSKTYTGINIANIVGGQTAWVGFTGADGGDVSTQTISNFQMISNQHTTMGIGQMTTATGTVMLTTDASIVAAQSGIPNLAGARLVVTSGGSVGSATLPLTTNITGAVNITAPTSINIDQVTGNLNLGQIQSSGKVNIQSPGNVSQIPGAVQGLGGNGVGWTFNARGYSDFSANVTDDVLTLTDGRTNEASSVWRNTPVTAYSFQASFTYTACGQADGVAFVLQNDYRGLHALGATGGYLGYSGIAASLAFEINIYGGSQRGINLGTNGAIGSGVYHAIAPVDLALGHPIAVLLDYDDAAKSFTVLMTDCETQATYTTSFTNIDLPALLGGPTATMGFTGAAGGLTSIQTISNFGFTPLYTGTLAAADLQVTSGGSLGSVGAPLNASLSASNKTGLQAHSGVYVNFNSPRVTLHNVMTDSGDILLSLPDLSTEGQIIALLADSLISTNTGNIILNAGDGFDFPEGSQVHATKGTILLNGDYCEADPAVLPNGNLLGEMTAQSLRLNSLGDGTTVHLTPANQDAFTFGSVFQVGSSDSSSHNTILASATDAAGFLYVTGIFWGTVDFDPGTGASNLTAAPGTGSAFVAKYTPTGSLEWASAFAGDFAPRGGGIAADGLGNVYFTQSFRGQVDFDPGPERVVLSNSFWFAGVVVKLGADGHLVWAKSFQTTANDTTCNAIAVDWSGSNVSVAGSFAGTVDFDPGPEYQIRVGIGSTDLFVSRLDGATGSYRFAYAMGSPWMDEANDLALDSSGNLFVTGAFSGWVDFDPGPGLDALMPSSIGKADCFVWKLGARGEDIWARQIGGIGAEVGAALTVDDHGFTFVAGNYRDESAGFNPDPTVLRSLASGSKDGVYAIKLDHDGEYIWAANFCGSGTASATAIDLDREGNLFVAGNFTGTIDFNPDAGVFNLAAQGASGFIARLGAVTGEWKWASRWEGEGQDQITALAVPVTGGRLFVAGNFTGSYDFDPGYGTATLSTAGGNELFLAELRYELPDEALVVGFGENVGTWVWKQTENWIYLHNLTPIWVVSGDVDANGKADLVVSFGGGGATWIYHDSGTWEWLHSISLTSGVAADINGDGRDEIIVSSNEISSFGVWAYYPASSTWCRLTDWYAQSFAVGDFDGNGKQDVAVDFGAGKGLWFWNNNTAWQYVHNVNPGWMAAGDFDGNGKTDLALSVTGTNDIWARLDSGVWQFIKSMANSTATAADANGDGRAELFVSITDPVYAGLWEYAMPVSSWKYSTDWRPESLASADVDGNGKKDIVADFGAKGLWVYKNDTVWQCLNGGNPTVVTGTRFGQTLVADDAVAPQSLAFSINAADLDSIIPEAKRRLALNGLDVALNNISVELADLADGILGEAIGNRILIDRDAAGYGWFVDQTPSDDVEYIEGDRAAAQHMDLLTAVMHEMGHTAGLADLDLSVDSLMSGRLKVGVRRK